MISIIVVTYNRRDLLKACLESLLVQDSTQGYEIIVIDNGSTDATVGYLRNLPEGRIKYFRNVAALSLAVCKEQGARLASGDILAFTDDDCLVSAEWLEELSKTMQTTDVAGGVVLPGPEVCFPAWWSRSMEWMAGFNSDPGLHFLPLGSNVAFQRKAFKELKLFSGVDSEDPYGEDNARVQAALDGGYRLEINKRMIVYHQISSERLTFPALVERCYREGSGWARREPVAAIFLVRIAALVAAPFRFLLSWDLNHGFRMVLSLGYIRTYLTGKKQVKQRFSRVE